MPALPGLAMEPNQANARPSSFTGRPRHSDAAVAAATNSVVKKEDPGDDATYRSRPQLPVPITLKRSLAELMKMMDAGVIDVDPDYQREVVWTADRMTGLINSLMENFYIPPIILNKKPRHNQDAPAPRETFVCVDGKQRLSSVLAFIKGMIPCHDYRGEKWWFCEPAGVKRKQVFSEQQQTQFVRKDFVSFEYDNLSPGQEEDLFARVQMGVQLNLAEKMRASTGPWQELAILFVNDFPSVYDLMKDRARSKDFQLTLSCFSQIVECMHPSSASGVPTLKTNHTHLPKLLSNKGAVDDALKSHLASVWNTIKELIDMDPDTFTNGNKYLRGVQTFAPVEMVAVTVLISMHSETRNNRLLLGDIQAMRTAVRESFVDLRLNAAVWKWFWEYIDELEAIRGTIDGSIVDRSTNPREKGKETRPAVNAASGSTAAAIIAASAAPKKGRFTARTKRLAVTVAEEAPVTVKQEQVTAQMPDPPLPKRRRTGDNQAAVAQLDKEPQRASLPRTTASTSGVNEEGGDPNVLLPPMSTHASMQSTQLAAQRPSMRPSQAPSAPPITASLSRSPSSLIHGAPHPAYPPTPLEVRQQRVSTLDSFHSAGRPMAYPSTSVSPAMHGQFIGEELRAPMASMVQAPHTQSRDQGKAGMGFVVSETQVAPQILTPPGARSRRPRPTQEDMAEAIDLTGDFEQERQDLLSSFRAKPLSSAPPLKTAKPAAASTARKRTSTAEATIVPSQELPSRENNPYARFKRG